jgi:hypothetical protein
MFAGCGFRSTCRRRLAWIDAFSPLWAIRLCRPSGGSGPGPSARAGLGAAPGGGVDQDGFLDAGEGSEEFAYRHGLTRAGSPASHQVGDGQGEYAGEDVDADVVVGPVVQGPEGDGAG